MRQPARFRRLNSDGVSSPGLFGSRRRAFLEPFAGRLAALPIVCGLFFAVVAMCGPRALYALDVPALSGRVNDYASMLSVGAEAAIEEKLAALEKEESTQIAVLTVPALDGEPIEDFSMRVVEAWKLGRGDFDNGALLLVAAAERRVRIEVGYGLEGSLTDLTAGRIVDNGIVPLFARGRFDEGVLKGVELMIAAVRGEYMAPDDDGRSGNHPSLPVIIIVLLILYFYSQVPRGGGGSGPLIFTGGPGGGFYGGTRSGGFGGGGGGFGGGGASGSW